MRNSSTRIARSDHGRSIRRPASAQDVHNLKIACVLDAQHPIVIGARHMAEVAEKESGGRLKISVYPSSQLGGQREVLQNMQAGIVDGVIDATATLTNFVPQLGSGRSAVSGKGPAAAFRLFDSPVFEQELGRPAAAAGFHIVQVWEITFRNVYTRSRPINAVADLKGQKIRVIPSPSYIALFRAFGAAPTPMAFGEVYTALQQGVIDGAENDSVTYQTTQAYGGRTQSRADQPHDAGEHALHQRARLAAPAGRPQGGDRQSVRRGAQNRDRRAHQPRCEGAGRDPRGRNQRHAAGPGAVPAIGQQTYKELAERLGPDLVDQIVAGAK